ncbi:MAG: exodeoxyribonuclease III [Bacilli bacterium]|nr:exodeoxyribonuclease III [Bacilli bacterium]
MKFITWNVNGLRACLKKDFKTFFDSVDADIFAIQETKMQEEQKEFDFPNYYEYWNSAEKKGYSGTLIYTKEKPLNVFYGLNEKYNDEGRAITLEFTDFYFVTIYSPNVQPELVRMSYRMAFEDDLKEYLISLNIKKPVILCGDMNVAHMPIDLKNPKTNERNPGYTFEEREKFSNLLTADFIDSFRYLYPDKIQYTWWSYRFNARNNNVGWRIDYFVVSSSIKEKIVDVIIHDKVLGSDHCPVEIDIKI